MHFNYTSIFVTDLGRGFATRSHNTSLTSKFSGIFEGQTWAPRSHGIKCHTFATLSQTGVTFCNFAETYVTTDNQCQLRFLEHLKNTLKFHSAWKLLKNVLFIFQIYYFSLFFFFFFFFLLEFSIKKRTKLTFWILS